VLVSINETKAAVPSLASATDPTITRRIKLAVETIENHLGRRLESREVVGQLVGCGSIYGAQCQLDRYPITAVAAVVLPEGPQGVGEVGPDTQLPLDPETVWRTSTGDQMGRLTRAAGWPCQFFVSYTGGYTSETLPEPLREAIFKVISQKGISDNEDTANLTGGQLRRERTVAGWEREWFQSLADHKTPDGLVTSEVATLVRPYMSYRSILS